MLPNVPQFSEPAERIPYCDETGCQCFCSHPFRFIPVHQAAWIIPPPPRSRKRLTLEAVKSHDTQRHLKAARALPLKFSLSL